MSGNCIKENILPGKIQKKKTFIPAAGNGTGIKTFDPSLVCGCGCNCYNINKNF